MLVKTEITVSARLEYNIPKDIQELLMSEEDVKKPENKNKPGFWWINKKDANLHYICADGEEDILEAIEHSEIYDWLNPINKKAK